MSAAAISEAVRAGRMSISESVNRALDACAADRCNAVTALLADRARTRAARMDAQGETNGPLAGVPFAVKNIFDVAGQTTRAGSAATDGDAPAREDAFVIRALEAAGAVLVATTNMDEFAYGFSGENAHDGDTLNPRDRRLSPGGSSSGSAALVASGAVPLALGTDTNGSARVPAALSGAIGFKPSYGRLSRNGVFPFVPSLDHVGIFAANVSDAARAFAAMDQPDPADPIAARVPQAELAAPRVARLGGWFAAPLQEDVATAMEAACTALDVRETLELRHAEEARAASFILTTSEGGQTHLARLAARPEGYGPLVRHRLTAGAMSPAIWTTRAQKLRRMVSVELADLHAQADILIAPATPCPAFPVGTDTHEVAGSALPIRLGIGMFTQALTLTGVPIIVLARRGELSGLPVGVQLIAAPHAEATLLASAAKLEAAGFHTAPEEASHV
ncbi:AtzE family amidohydrolase [uncultured Marivita sp.]|uniref:AtzE family amidohydrolase n=1 Tax=uncultured Marivita sp. TaxID=888080 RepID=UPI00260D115E|nr:AtzE family amidohydrolase [uncultured Marivita sp.]